MSYYVTLDELNNRLDEIKGISPFNGTPIDLNYQLNNGQSLASMRSYALDRVNGLLKTLGFSPYPTGIDELNKKIQQYHQTTAYFNGPNLQQYIINPIRGIIQTQIRNTSKEFDNFLLQHTTEMTNTFMSTVEKIAADLQLELDPKYYTAIVNEMFARLNFVEGRPTGGTLLSNEDKELAKSAITQIRKGLISDGNDPNFIALIKGPQANNRNFRKRLINLAKGNGINVDWLEEYYIQNSDITGSITTTDDTFTLYTDFTGLYTSQMQGFAENGVIAEKAAKAFFDTKKTDKEFMNQLYQVVENYFLQFFPQGHNLQPYFVKAIDSIVEQYPAAFFQGRNESGIIGIFGELQGLYYLYAILGENANINPNTMVQWIGGDTTQGDNGIKTGADLIVKIGESLGYGIQVKNSMDLTGSTNFSDFSLNIDGGEQGFISQLVKFGIDQSTVSAIEDLLTMETFNVPYRMEGRKRVEKSPKGPGAELFLNDRADIDELYLQAHKLMAIAAAAIMRIDYMEEEGAFTQRNTLWLIGGTAAIASVQILDNLIKQLEDMQRSSFFNASAITRDAGKNRYTIVDYLNGSGDLQGLKTVLRTSYNFHR